MIKIAILSLSASALLFSASLASVSGPDARKEAPVIGDKDHPILLKRMVVTATPLPE